MNDQLRNDPNVTLPPQVIAASQRADEIAAQIRNTPPVPPSRQHLVTNNSDPRNEPPPVEPDDWEHKFNSAKGRLDAAEARARAQSVQISELQRLLAMSSGGPVAPPPPVSPVQPPNVGAVGDVRFGGGQPVVPKFITPKEKEEYGDELLDVMGRRTMEIVGPEFQKLSAAVSQLMAENAQLKAQVGGVRNVVSHDATGRFYDTLDKEIPDWEMTNQDPGFSQWLGMVDPFSGRLRKDLLDEAHRNHEASRVLNIIRGYRNERAAVNPVRDLQPNAGNGATPPPNSGAGIRQPSPVFELQNLAAPGRAKSGQPPMPPDQPFITNDDIRRFYADVTKGVYEGRDADKAAREQQLFLAAREGRIR